VREGISVGLMPSLTVGLPPWRPYYFCCDFNSHSTLTITQRPLNFAT
jgi:hypothetical protein